MKKVWIICVSAVVCVAMLCGSFIYVGKGFNKNLEKIISAVSEKKENSSEIPVLNRRPNRARWMRQRM